MNQSSNRRKFWTAAATHWSQEERAAHHVEAQGHEFYLPRFSSIGTHTTGRRAGQKYDRRELLFPGYIMIRVQRDWKSLMHTRGILKLFLRDEKLVLMRTGDVEAIKSREDERGLVRLRQFEKGQTVTIGSGPYTGLDGIVQETPAFERCLVLLHMLGREVVGEFDERNLSAA